MEKSEENVIEFLNRQDRAACTLNKTAWVNRAKRLKDANAEDVDLTENADGSVFMTVPVSWVKISPPRSRNMTDEQRREASERLARYRAGKS